MLRLQPAPLTDYRPVYQQSWSQDLLLRRTRLQGIVCRRLTVRLDYDLCKFVVVKAISMIKIQYR